MRQTDASGVPKPQRSQEYLIYHLLTSPECEALAVTYAVHVAQRSLQQAFDDHGINRGVAMRDGLMFIRELDSMC